MLKRKLIALLCLSACNLNAAIDIIFDYSYDNSNFFGNEQKYIMEQVAYAFESRMFNTNFIGFRPVEDHNLNSFNTASSFPRIHIAHGIKLNIGSPSPDGNIVGKSNELIIFLRSAHYSSGSYPSGGVRTIPHDGSRSWTNGPEDEVYREILRSKDNSTNFEPLAGNLLFNKLGWGQPNYYFDTDLTSHSDAATSNKVDFYSAMIREVAEVLGFHTQSNAWQANKIDVRAGVAEWSGPNAKEAYSDQNVPLHSPNAPYWSNHLHEAKVVCDCHPAMYTNIGTYERTPFSDLDFALLKDIGYSISDSPLGTNIGGTYSDPTWGGTYDVPVNMTYSDWLASGGGNYVPQYEGGSAAPEPHYIFPILGGLMCLLFGRKEKRLNFIRSKFNPLKTIPHRIKRRILKKLCP